MSRPTQVSTILSLCLIANLLINTNTFFFKPLFDKYSYLFHPFDNIKAFHNFFNEEFEEFYQTKPDEATFKREYDFIIVGAGTAGCVLANRLTEKAEWDVLLVEAGYNENLLMDVPLLVNFLQLTEANWKYKTEPSDNYCTGFDKHQCHFPRGKVLGGSSVLNYMIYTRGNKHDFDNWKYMGNEGWGWIDVFPYFKKIENFEIPEFYDPLYHSKDGNLHVEYSPFRTALGKAWVEAAKSLGFSYGDLNGPISAGVSFTQFSMKNGTRHSSNRAYLHPIRQRPNLYISKGSFVTELIFDDSQTKVIGIKLEKNGIDYKILAKKEVILSAGAINSPQLLMVSGIGPKEHLTEKNIETVKNLPVGFNLMDHVGTGGLSFVVNKQNVTISQNFVLQNKGFIFEWMRSHGGPLSVAGGIEAILLTQLNDKFNTTGWPDVELLFIAGSVKSESALRQNFNFDKNVFDEVYGKLGEDAFMVFPLLMRPKSKGRIKLKSKDPKVPPEIIPNYFENPQDLDKIVKGVEIAINISKQPAMKKLGAKLYDVPIKKCLNEGPFGSFEYFKCQTKMFSFTIYHQSGACKMGPKSDPTAVVNNRLKVHGIENLRVIDVSIMPYITSTHPNAVVYMIAEKGADMIKQDWEHGNHSHSFDSSSSWLENNDSHSFDSSSSWLENNDSHSFDSSSSWLENNDSHSFDSSKSWLENNDSNSFDSSKSWLET